jgi:CBS domain-containing protein
MINCPDCGHENFAGADHCDHCGRDLQAHGLPALRAGLQQRIMETPLRELDPAPALVVPPTEPLGAVIRLMQERRIGSALIVDNGKVVGIFTERDALTRVAGRGLNVDKVPVSRMMTRNPKVLRDDDTLAFAMHCMAVGSYRHIPVVADGRPPRFVSVRGVLRYLNEHTR